MKQYHRIAGPCTGYARFRFDADGQAATYVMHDSYCDEPSCTAGEADVLLVDIDDPSRRIPLWFDLLEGHIRLSDDLPEIDKAIACEFADDRRVQNLLVRHRQLVRAWALSQSREGVRVEAEARTYNFREFDLNNEPYAMPFQGSERSWHAVDQYCVDPRCSCEEAMLSFFDVTEAQSTVTEAMPAVRIELRSGEAADAMTDAPLTSEQADLLAEFQHDMEAWLEELRLRRKLIRDIAARRLRRAGGPVQTVRTIGRNASCPCGSGRKYKHCCGAAGRKSADAASL